MLTYGAEITSTHTTDLVEKVHSNPNTDACVMRAMVDGAINFASIVQNDPRVSLLVYPLRGAAPLATLISTILEEVHGNDLPVLFLPIGTSKAFPGSSTKGKESGIKGSSKVEIIKQMLEVTPGSLLSHPIFIDEAQSGSTGTQAAIHVQRFLEDGGYHQENLQVLLALDRRHNKKPRNIAGNLIALLEGRINGLRSTVSHLPLPTVDNASALPIMYKHDLNNELEIPTVSWNMSAEVLLRSLMRLALYGENIITFRDDAVDRKNGVFITSSDANTQEWINTILGRNHYSSELQFKRWLQRFIHQE